MIQTAEQDLENKLKDSRIKKNAYYRPGQVQRLLNICDRKFRELCDRYEERGRANRKLGINADKLLGSTHRRVSHGALIEYFEDLQIEKMKKA